MPDSPNILSDPAILAGGFAEPLLDVRSPSEYRAGHIPQARNLPLLDDEARHRVGLTYREKGHQAAVREGFHLVGPRFASFIDQAGTWAPEGALTLYCWRGGLRSQIMAWVLSTSGLQVRVLEGGYKSWRKWCLGEFSSPGPIRILSGMTGSGKTGVLHALRDLGQPVVDLEELAHHRGSAFGGLGQLPQPSQEQFENNLAAAYWRSRCQGTVWMEDESRFIGRLRIPDALYARMQEAARYILDVPFQQRVERILADYGGYGKDVLAETTSGLSRRFGSEQTARAIGHLHRGEWEEWAGLLLGYYDRTYAHGMQVRARLDQEPARHLHVGSGDSFEAIARRLIQI